MNRFALDFAAFLGAATLCALVSVATITSACQAARGVSGSGKVSQARDNGLSSRPQDGLRRAVNTPPHTGGKRSDLYAATARVAGSSPGLVRSSVPRINSFGETGLVSAQGELSTGDVGTTGPTIKRGWQSVTAGETALGIIIEPSELTTHRALVNRHTRAPRLVGLVNADRDLGAMRPSHLRVTLGRDRDFERESPTPYRITRSARPVRDGGGVAPSYTPQVALSRGVHHEPGSAHLPGGRAGAYLYEVTAYSHGCIMPVVGAEGHARRAANGRWPVADVTVAADTRLHPFGTEVLIEGLGFRTVGDRGHAIKGRRLDLFVDSCREARKFGRRWMAVSTVPPESTRFGSLGSAR